MSKAGWLSASDTARRGAVAYLGIKLQPGTPRTGRQGCLRLFQRTAESVVAATGSQAIALALQQSNAKSNRPLRERVWALRCAFDALIDELVSQEESTVAKLLNRG